MARKPRPTSLTPAERSFRLDDWVTRHMVVEERNGPEWVCSCPQCGRAKLAVHVGRKVFQCLSAACGFRSWRPRYLVAAVLNTSTQEADEIIAAAALGRSLGPVQPLRREEQTHRRTIDIPLAALPPVIWGLDHAPAQRQYIRGRGIPDEHARGLGLGVVQSDRSGSKADRALTGRVIFPIWVHGKLVFWVARDTTGRSKAKVINMPRPCRTEAHGPYCACYLEEWGLPAVPQAATADEVVVGLHWVSPGMPVIIVEGPTDVAVCGPQFVGTLGAHLSYEQALLIAGAGASEAIILWDGDDGGRNGAPKAAEVLGAAMPTRWTTCPDGTDPGTLGRAQALALAAAAPQAGGLRPLPSVAQAPRLKRADRPPFLSPLEKR